MVARTRSCLAGESGKPDSNETDMFRTKYLFAGLVLSVVAGSSIAEAAQPNYSCSDRASALSHLSKKFSEEPIVIGLANNGGVVEVLTYASRTTWSIIITTPDGTACMFAAGEH